MVKRWRGLWGGLMYLIFGERCAQRQVMCSNPADPRCVAGYCTEHCREAENCGGACITIWKRQNLTADRLLEGVAGRKGDSKG